MAVPKERTYTAEEYYSMKDLPESCELINGFIIQDLSSPNNTHQRLSRELCYEIHGYIKRNRGKCELFPAPADVKLSESTILQPDLYITCHPERLDGQRHIGAPDLVIEIVSQSSITLDYVTKLSLYHESGVREYWIVDPMKSRVHVYLWDEEKEKNEVNVYSFEDSIPVGIYKDNGEPLFIRIADFPL